MKPELAEAAAGKRSLVAIGTTYVLLPGSCMWARAAEGSRELQRAVESCRGLRLQRAVEGCRGLERLQRAVEGCR
eukprot:338018-Chlamydomonas_euryale.AAC.1